jgi:UDP-glucose 4-epimerase
MSDTLELTDGIAGESVLVTGASGFIGSHLCHRLISCGAIVHAVSREPQRSESEYLQWRQVNFMDIASLRQVCGSVRPKIVFHLASHVQGARQVGLVLPTFYGNLASTVHLLTVLSEIGCDRVVLACSQEEPVTIDSAAFARSPYAAAKWASSIYGRMFYELFQLPVVMPRVFMVYGPNQKDRQKLVPFVITHLLRGEVPKLGSGRRRADWIYVDDVVEGLLRAAISPGIEGSAFDLGTGSLVSVREIVEHISEIVSSNVQPEFGALPDRPFEQERSADTAFLFETLGYRPSTSLKCGLEATVAWYRQELKSSIESPSHSHRIYS